MAFRKGGLPCSPADFQILVVDCLVCFEIGNGSLNARNDLHPLLGFLHSCADCSGFLIHALQGCVQIFQREKFMVLQIVHSLGNGFQVTDRAFLLSVSRPLAALRLSQIQIRAEKCGKRGRSVFLIRFHLRKGGFGDFQNLRNPSPQIFDGSSDSVHHAVSRLNISVEIADVGFNTLAL